MQYKYGEYTQEQVHDYKKKLHSLVHWLLIYKEQKSKNLDNYFNIVQSKLDGYDELVNHPDVMVEIMNLVESARLESKKEDYSHKLYRSLILDTHDLIDKLPEVDKTESGQTE